MNKNILKLNIISITLIVIASSCKKEDKASLPILTTSAISVVTANSATSGGNITDDGGATITSRGVCWSIEQTPTILDKKTVDGAGAGSFSSTLTELDGGKTYFIRAYATNKSGTGYGMALSFKTLGDMPTATTKPATNITTTTAELNSIVNGNYLTTSVSFEYGLSTTYGNIVTPISKGDNIYIGSISGLAVGTVYHFRVKAVNALGTTYGSDQSFKTLGAAPIVITLNATEVQTNSAILNGNVYANDLSTSASFEYGLTTSYGNTSLPPRGPVNGGTNMGFGMTSSISGLSNNTLYHFRLVATNLLGTTYGNDLTFTTLGKAPTIISYNANKITSNSASLNSMVNGNGYPTEVTFEFGLSEDYGVSIIAMQSPIGGGKDTLVNIDLDDLTPDTKYHFRVKAINQLGTTFSLDQTFTTSIIVNDYESNFYSTVTLGDQIWMAEDLASKKLNDGTSIPYISVLEDWKNLTGMGYWLSGLGELYNWECINTGKLCPSGWRVPSEDDWIKLVDFLVTNGYGNNGSGNEIGKSLAFTSKWEPSNIFGTVGYDQAMNNASGFSALPAGLISYIDGKYYGGTSAIWWTSTEKDTNTAFYKTIHYNASGIYGNSENKRNAFSVRCMKNK